MMLPGRTPTPWSNHTRPTSPAIDARTKRVRPEREEPLVVTVVGCIAGRDDALEVVLDRRR
jgi:hypothetical protein